MISFNFGMSNSNFKKRGEKKLKENNVVRDSSLLYRGHKSYHQIELADMVLTPP